jgi:hypothetical protein
MRPTAQRVRHRRRHPTARPPEQTEAAPQGDTEARGHGAHGAGTRHTALPTLVPHTPVEAHGFHDAQIPVLRSLLEAYLREHDVDDYDDDRFMELMGSRGTQH